MLAAVTKRMKGKFPLNVMQSANQIYSRLASEQNLVGSKVSGLNTDRF